MDKTNNIAIVGLGYVGLPLAWELSNYHNVIGFDINANRIRKLNDGVDYTGEIEITSQSLKKRRIVFTNDEESLLECNVYIVTVPTPVDEFNVPDLDPIISATRQISIFIKEGDLIIYESTVYPGVTEDICVKIIEESSGLKLNQHFSVGYSPERINPGDKEHTLTDIVKVVSGSCEKAVKQICNVYSPAVKAGLHVAPNIKTAEAAKVIENIQRDVNIALMNELTKIFNDLGLSTKDVLEAAGTKWNFLKFEPGLVGGHCIGVDPYYLIHRAAKSGVSVDIIETSRRINNNMTTYYSEKIMGILIKNRLPASVNIFGLTFKENCGDFRNSKTIDLVNKLINNGVECHLFDPLVDLNEFFQETSLRCHRYVDDTKRSLSIICVKHDEYVRNGVEKFKEITDEKGFIVDLKYIFKNDKKLVHF